LYYAKGNEKLSAGISLEAYEKTDIENIRFDRRNIESCDRKLDFAISRSPERAAWVAEKIRPQIR
jgi:hypothetical protein